MVAMFQHWIFLLWLYLRLSYDVVLICCVDTLFFFFPDTECLLDVAVTHFFSGQKFKILWCVYGVGFDEFMCCLEFCAIQWIVMTMNIVCLCFEVKIINFELHLYLLGKVCVLYTEVLQLYSEWKTIKL
jgi:hypothetical protein